MNTPLKIPSHLNTVSSNFWNFSVIVFPLRPVDYCIGRSRCNLAADSCGNFYVSCLQAQSNSRFSFLESNATLSTSRDPITCWLLLGLHRQGWLLFISISCSHLIRVSYCRVRQQKWLPSPLIMPQLSIRRHPILKCIVCNTNRNVSLFVQIEYGVIESSEKTVEQRPQHHWNHFWRVGRYITHQGSLPLSTTIWNSGCRPNHAPWRLATPSIKHMPHCRAHSLRFLFLSSLSFSFSFSSFFFLFPASFPFLSPRGT